jgi:hypothetical protein
VAPADLFLLADALAGFTLLALQLDLVKPRPCSMSQQMARFWCCDRSDWLATAIPVGMMRDAHRAFGGVDVLAARARRTIDVDAHVFFRNFDLDGLSSITG